ncbi:MAG TPA: TonB-dependent receptor [Pseudomonadales bacterium]|nr:TonB-dependent receptor [Pseudomonadales bacterium]
MKFKLSKTGMLTHSVAVITALTAGAAFAAEEVEEITVTAQRRAESIQEVPLAVSAFTGTFVQQTNLDDIKDLVKFTPGVTGDSHDSFIDTLSVRGIVTNDFGVGGDPSIGVFKNNIYQGRNGEVVTTLYDLDRAEILRGPQGFLFGRNSIAGAISVFTKQPDFKDYDGYVSADLAERNHEKIEGAINVPISDTFAMRVAAFHTSESGYVDNVDKPDQNQLIAPDNSGGRISLRYQDDTLDVNFMAEYEHRKQSGSVYRATEKGQTWEEWVAIDPTLTMPSGNRNISSNQGLGEEDDSNIWSYDLEIDKDLGFATLTSQTGFKDHEYVYAEDFDAMPIAVNDYAQNQKGTYFEQEFRLVSQNTGAFTWYTGVSFYRETIDVLFSQHADEEAMCEFFEGESCAAYIPGFTPSPVGLLEQNRVKGDYHGWASYVDLSYAFNDVLDASLGVRYTYDKKEFENDVLPVESELGPFYAMGFTTDGYVKGNRAWDAFTPRFIVRYHPDNDWMMFASVTRGYKSGGYGSFALNPDEYGNPDPVTNGEAKPDTFAPEHVWSYEIGTKGEMFDGTLRVAANTYYYTYEDLQVNVPGNGGGIVVGNVGKVDGWGFETTIEWVATENIDVYLAGAYGDSKVNSAEALCDGSNQCDGKPLPQVPKYSGSAVVTAHLPYHDGEFTASSEVYAQSRTYGGLLQLSEAVNTTYYDLTLRGGYRANAGWSVIAYVENVTNQVFYDGVAEGNEDGGLPAHYFGPSRPRTVGLTMSWEF